MLGAQILQTSGDIETILTRTIVIGMVEHVEEVSRESHVHALLDSEILEQRKIHVPGSRSLVKRSGIGIYDKARCAAHKRSQSGRAIGQYLRKLIVQVGSQRTQYPLCSPTCWWN